MGKLNRELVTQINDSLQEMLDDAFDGATIQIDCRLPRMGGAIIKIDIVDRHKKSLMSFPAQTLFDGDDITIENLLIRPNPLQVKYEPPS